MIRVTQYCANGNEQSSHDYETVELAFEACERLKLTFSMYAIAVPVGTTAGCYVYEPRKESHTLEGFRKKLACCCKCSADYYENLYECGIVSRPLI
jgi:hypothetical protein